MITRKSKVSGVIACLAATGAANAAQINVGNPNNGIQAADQISVSTTWTANNTYNLRDQIFVMPGVTLTIEAGTVIASDTNGGLGSLAVSSGAQIFVNGTAEEPVIMTSQADVDTWDPLPAHPTGRDPKTGTWRAAANEWGNLTIMGEAFISENAVAGNIADCDPDNVAVMEGLVVDAGDTFNLYGGNQDNDDSGSIHYLSIRYGGDVIAVTNELNGLSLGGVGRNTEIDHVDIMNNVDDGVEIWGGTVNLKYINIWNIGDDSFDLDQGWRGKAQFGLIVQGSSLSAAQGSGVGDNAFETDGAEQADFQPVTTAAIYNFTVVGQPGGTGGDHGTAWRDNARIQYRNCIFMDLGERLVSFDNIDGDGGLGYGHNGTLSWADTWTTDYTYSDSNHPPLPICTANPDARYEAQSAGDSSIGQGKLAEITDSVFFRNLGGAAYTEANARGVTIAGGSNPAKGNIVATNMPIAALTRGAAVPLNGGALTNSPVATIDPRAANDATSSIASAPNDGFFTPAAYRGGFGTNENWLCQWTAADAFGFNVAPPGGCLVVTCSGDTDGDNDVDADDLVNVVLQWGTVCPCTGDVDEDSDVDTDDLVIVVLNWGPCK